MIRKWVERRIAELTGDDQDDVVPGFVISQLEQEDISQPDRRLDPKMIQVQLTGKQYICLLCIKIGFLGEHAAPFCSELWRHLLSA